MSAPTSRPRIPEPQWLETTNHCDQSNGSQLQRPRLRKFEFIEVCRSPSGMADNAMIEWNNVHANNKWNTISQTCKGLSQYNDVLTILTQWNKRSLVEFSPELLLLFFSRHLWRRKMSTEQMMSQLANSHGCIEQMLHECYLNTTLLLRLKSQLILWGKNCLSRIVCSKQTKCVRCNLLWFTV